MADCPGVLHLAEMADGGLARLRVPGGQLSPVQARAVADLSERLGSGVVDLTNRANLQIRGLSADAGPALVRELENVGFRFRGEADRRRNVLLDPFSGIDSQEIRDLRTLAAALEQALAAAQWIERLSPKFSFVLDGGGASRVSGVPSDVVVTARPDGIEIAAGGRRVLAPERAALAAMLAIAETASGVGPDARAADLSEPALRCAFGAAGKLELVEDASRPTVAPRYGVVDDRTGAHVALALAVPVGRLDGAMIRFLADAAEREGQGRLTLAPWSAVVVPGVGLDRAARVMADAETVGFVPTAVADRLAVVACSGAPACERAREPAKALAAEILKLSMNEPDRLPPTRLTLHLSACSKGCAGSAPADVLLLGSSERDGWSIHASASPRAPGESLGRTGTISAEDLLARLAR